MNSNLHKHHIETIMYFMVLIAALILIYLVLNDKLNI